MRIDKYLWCTRYCKTRNIGTEACKKGHVRINEAIVKASREVYPGDKITYRKNQIDYQIIVLDIPANRVGAKLVDIYRQDVTPAEAFAHADMVKLSQEYYRKKGTGRPTKKDRRDIDGFLDEDEPTDNTSSATPNN